MKTPVKSVALLLPFVLAACAHKNEQAKNHPTAPPIVDKPTTPPTTTPTELPASAATVPPAPTAEITPPAQPTQKPPKKSHHPKQQDQPKPTEQASNTAPVEVSAIGQLSPGASSDLRDQTVESISTTEHGLKDIGNRSLNDQEQKTVAQIKEFLKQARTALDSGDVDGAHTLAVKAKVLFGEINQ
jgi:outer membrane biosynthesis protein TonB